MPQHYLLNDVHVVDDEHPFSPASLRARGIEPDEQYVKDFEFSRSLSDLQTRQFQQKL